MDQLYINLWSEKIQLLTNELSETAEQCNKKFDELTSETTSEDSTKTCEKGLLRNLYSKIEADAQAAVDRVQKELENHQRTVNEKKLEIERLKAALQSAKTEYEDEKKEIEKYKNKVDVINQKTEGMEDLKYPILTYKLLTGANFAYQDTATSTKGYIQGINGQQIPFEFDNSQLGDQEQTEQIWSLVETASHKSE